MVHNLARSQKCIITMYYVSRCKNKSRFSPKKGSIMSSSLIPSTTLICDVIHFNWFPHTDVRIPSEYSKNRVAMISDFHFAVIVASIIFNNDISTMSIGNKKKESFSILKMSLPLCSFSEIHSLSEMVAGHFGKYTSLLSGGETDEKKYIILCKKSISLSDQITHWPAEIILTHHILKDLNFVATK